MFDQLHLVAPFAAFLIGVCAFWTVRRIALAVGFVDNPDRWRKLQEAPIPLGGGLALWLATWSGWGSRGHGERLPGDQHRDPAQRGALGEPP